MSKWLNYFVIYCFLKFDLILDIIHFNTKNKNVQVGRCLIKECSYYIEKITPIRWFSRSFNLPKESYIRSTKLKKDRSDGLYKYHSNDQVTNSLFILVVFKHQIIEKQHLREPYLVNITAFLDRFDFSRILKFHTDSKVCTLHYTWEQILRPDTYLTASSSIVFHHYLTYFIIITAYTTNNQAILKLNPQYSHVM